MTRKTGGSGTSCLGDASGRKRSHSGGAGSPRNSNKCVDGGGRYGSTSFRSIRRLPPAAGSFGRRTAVGWQPMQTRSPESDPVPALPATYTEERPSADPRSAAEWHRLGQDLQSQGRIAESEQAFRRVLAANEDHVDSRVSLAIALARQGKRAEAEEAFRAALQRRPDHAKAHNNFGVLLAEMGRRKEAFEAWRRAAELDPNYPEAQFNFAMVLAETGDRSAAVRQYERTLELKPDYAEALNNLGLLLDEMGQPHESVVLLEQAVRLRPDYAEAWNNLALARVNVGRADEALAAYREALRLRPNEAELHNNLGTALAALNRPEEALACYRHALRLRPDYPEARWHQALTWLTIGDFEKGWAEYEWRWRRRRSRPRTFDKPLWDGAPLEGETLLLWCEQGLGDAIQFVRFAAEARRRVGRVVLEGPAVLKPLLSGCVGVDEWVDFGEALPPFAAHAPLLSLPKIFGTTTATIPCGVPYLAPEADRQAAWRRELEGSLPPGDLKVGVAWQGNPLHRWDRHRSFSLERFADIAKIRGVSLVSLQKGTGGEQLAVGSLRHRILDLGAKADADGAFRDTPAIVANLDLTICCDTSLAHLAGAMNVPVWIPLARMSDWRWLRGRNDSPWYPSLRLFRQKIHGDWDGPFECIAAELRAWAAERRAAATA